MAKKKKETWTPPGLPKWPAMVVVGERVTVEQAMEIIVRTNSGGVYVSTNDQNWERKVRAEFGLEPDHFRGFNRDENESEEERIAKLESKWAKEADARAALGMLDLEYIGNDRIASCWIGGTKGWCNWDGTIFSNNYNIGKWPDCDTVMNEWELVAKTFPFLDLTCALFSGETCEDGARPLVAYRVKNGMVVMGPPPDDFAKIDDMFETDEKAEAVYASRSEIGCTVLQLRQAVQIARRSQMVNPEAIEAVPLPEPK